MERRSTKTSQSASFFRAATLASRQPTAVSIVFCSWNSLCNTKSYHREDEEIAPKYTYHAVVSPFQSLELLGVILAEQCHVHVDSHGQIPKSVSW